MERQPPDDIGDDGMAPRQARLSEPIQTPSLRLVRDGDRSSLYGPVLIGSTVAMPDLVLDQSDAEKLTQSGWRALVCAQKASFGNVWIHEGIRDIVRANTRGRSAYTAFSDTEVKVNLAIEDDSPESHELVRRLGKAILSFVDPGGDHEPYVAIYPIRTRRTDHPTFPQLRAAD